MLMGARFGVTDLRRAAIYARAIEAVIDQVYPRERPSLLALEPLISEQLVLLETAFKTSRAGGGLSSAGVFPPAEVSVVAEEPQPEPSEPEQKPARRRRQVLQGESRIEAKSMEEKLRDEREPLNKLLSEDCVQVGLIDKKQAKKMIRSMLGKQPQEAEQQIVEQLRQVLQDQVKTAIRRNKGGPWGTPQAQEDMRQDIHAARSVKSVLMLARQIAKELHQWSREHGKGGLLGMFG